MNEITGNVKVHLSGLEEPMRSDLLNALRSISCQVTDEARSAEIVFCGCDPGDFGNIVGAFGQTPVVVVSRAPDMTGWLDALEAGAADYCAAPFESIQLRWLLDAHTRHTIPSVAA
jgi:CheY-like chemotaxis protein